MHVNHPSPSSNRFVPCLCSRYPNIELGHQLEYEEFAASTPLTGQKRGRSPHRLHGWPSLIVKISPTLIYVPRVEVCWDRAMTTVDLNLHVNWMNSWSHLCALDVSLLLGLPYYLAVYTTCFLYYDRTSAHNPLHSEEQQGRSPQRLS